MNLTEINPLEMMGKFSEFQKMIKEKLPEIEPAFRNFADCKEQNEIPGIMVFIQNGKLYLSVSKVTAKQDLDVITLNEQTIIDVCEADLLSLMLNFQKMGIL